MAVTLSEIAINSTHLSGNPIMVKATTSGIPAGAEEYKILLKIVSADNVLVGSPFIDSIAPDANGVAWFDISGYVHQPIPIDFKFPLSGRFNAYQDASYDIWLYPGESYIDSNGDPSGNIRFRGRTFLHTSWQDFATGDCNLQRFRNKLV